MSAESDVGRLGTLESQVMRELWHREKGATVREVLDALNSSRRPPLAYTTVMTVLSRLHDKGIVTREPAGRGFRYLAAVAGEAEIAVRDVVRAYGDAAVAGFVDEARADPRLLARLRHLLDEAP